jgi:superkiller protein 3
VSAEHKKKHKHSISKYKLVVIIILVVLALVAGTIGVLWMLNKDKATYKQIGKIAEEYSRQLPALSEKVDKDPNDATARREYAIALRATGDLKGSKEQYEAAVKLNSRDATLENNLGNVYRDLSEYDNAVAAYNKAIELNNKQLNPYINLANLQLYQLKKVDDAIATYQKGLEALPDDENLLLQLALTYERADKKQLAQETLEKIINKNPNNIAAKKLLERLKG